MFNSFKNKNHHKKGVNTMKLTDKIKCGLMTAFAAGSAAMSGAMTAHAEGDLDGVECYHVSRVVKRPNV